MGKSGTPMERYVHDFDQAAELGRDLLGGKGAGLAEMTAIGIPVPAGFIVTTEACLEYRRGGREMPDGLEDEVRPISGGSRRRPASGSGTSRIPPRFGPFGRLRLDARDDGHDPQPRPERRGGPGSGADDRQRALCAGCVQASRPDVRECRRRRRCRCVRAGAVGAEGGAGAAQDVDLSPEDLIELVERFKRVYRDATGSDFPQDLRSSFVAPSAPSSTRGTTRAQVYRRANDIPDDLGTAVSVVQMVFGNKGGDSGTGVAFTRDPATGEQGIWGEFLTNAQGEDVVAGIRTPQPIAEMKAALPEAYDQLVETMQRLEEHYREMQDIEFTVEDGRLYLLQTRSGKRTAQAALRIAVEMVDEGLITKDEAVARIDPVSSTSFSIR